jgi:hypothetical protein
VHVLVSRLLRGVRFRNDAAELILDANGQARCAYSVTRDPSCRRTAAGDAKTLSIFHGRVQEIVATTEGVRDDASEAHLPGHQRGAPRLGRRGQQVGDEDE